MKIDLVGKWETREIYLNGKLLTPGRSQKYHNHSPNGFNWGYAGSGPAQLALAICLEVIPTTRPNYQKFKFDHIATLPQTDFTCEIIFEEEDYIPKPKLD